MFYILGDIDFRWIHRQADLFMHDQNIHHLTKRVLQESKKETGNVAPIILFGYEIFPEPNFKGHGTAYHRGHPESILRAYSKRQFKLPDKVVLMGGMNENWGFLSTHFLNRTW